MASRILRVLTDRLLFREACVAISTRAARLSATGIVALLEQAGSVDAPRQKTIAVDGSVFECYPFFKERVERGIIDLVGDDAAASIRLVLAKDGSGVGAAIIAAIAGKGQ